MKAGLPSPSLLYHHLLDRRQPRRNHAPSVGPKVTSNVADLPLVEDLGLWGLDLNPVIVSPSGAVVVDAKIRLAPWRAHPEDAVRRLRTS